MAMLDMENNFTQLELLDRVWDRENVRMVMDRHSYYYSNDWRREELDTLWVKESENRKTASLGYNNGFYVGMDDVAKQYVGHREDERYERLKAYNAADASIGVSAANLGYGLSNIYTMTTPLIYIADDGKTARFLGYRLGFKASGNPDGTSDAYLDFGLVFADLVKEGGDWRIWHLILQHDHAMAVGEDYSLLPVELAPGQDPMEKDFGTTTVQRQVHDPVAGWEYLWYDMARPYATYIEKDGYGPYSNHGKQYYERERR